MPEGPPAIEVAESSPRAIQTAQAGPKKDSAGILAVPNEVDNEEQIDQPDKLEEATDNPNAVSSDDLARELSNPNTPLAKLTVKSTLTVYEGELPEPEGQVGNLILLQPVFPFPLTDDGTRNLFIRPAFAFLTPQLLFNPGTADFNSKVRVADMGFDVALGQSFDNGMIAVAGMQGTLPVGHNDVSGDQLRLGPEAIVAYINEVGALAASPAHQWDVLGPGSDFSTSTLELFALKFLQGGWTVGTNPVLAYDWEGDQASIPVNGTVRKVVKFGNIPVQISASFDYFVENDDTFGQDYAFTLNFTLIVPNFIYNLFN